MIADIEVTSLVNLDTFVPAVTSESVRIALERTLDDGKIGTEDADPGFIEVGKYNNHLIIFEEVYFSLLSCYNKTGSGFVLFARKKNYLLIY